MNVTPHVVLCKRSWDARMEVTNLGSVAGAFHAGWHVRVRALTTDHRRGGDKPSDGPSTVSNQPSFAITVFCLVVKMNVLNHYSQKSITIYMHSTNK